VELWRTDLAKTNPVIAQSLANPEEYPNLFQYYSLGIEAQKLFRPELNLTVDSLPSAAEYLNKVNDLDRDLIEEITQLKQPREPTTNQTEYPSNVSSHPDDDVVDTALDNGEDAV